MAYKPKYNIAGVIDSLAPVQKSKPVELADKPVPPD